MEAGKLYEWLERRVLVLDVDKIISRHYTAALNDKNGSTLDHWRAALDEILSAANVEIINPVTPIAEEAGPVMRSASEIAMGRAEVQEQASAITERVTTQAAADAKGA